MTKADQPDLDSPNSFHGYYNFHFAAVNCVTQGDLCQKLGIKAYPTFNLYKNGEFVEKFVGSKSMQGFSDYLEEKLEGIKPGSRPRDGVKVPEAGATGTEKNATPEKPAAKDKDPAAGVAAGEKHNEKVEELKATLSTSAVLSSETAKNGRKNSPKKTGPLPNPLGQSIPLDADSFQKLVTNSQDGWFIKFYVPWCSHCQHLAPVWAQMAKEMEGKLNIGEVNCEKNSRLCKDAKVNAYPTIHFFRGGERVEYNGLRGLGDLVSFTGKALDSDLKYVDAAAFKEMEETEEVIFLYIFDHATTSEDFLALDRLTLSLIGHGKIVKTDDPILASRFKVTTWPRLLVSRDGRPSYYTALSPQDMRDFRKVLTWMQSVWQPLVPELSPTNAKDILNGRYAVLGVLDRARPDEFAQSRRELKNAALEWMDKQTQLFQLERQELRDSKQLRIEEAEDRDDQRALRQAKSMVISITEDTFRKGVNFAWVDGVFWERWLRSTYGIDVTKGERVIINDEDVSILIPEQ
jgi:protein disulfide-isomerase